MFYFSIIFCFYSFLYIHCFLVEVFHLSSVDGGEPIDVCVALAARHASYLNTGAGVSREAL